MTMELLLIPLLLLTGTTLIFFGVNGLPALPRLHHGIVGNALPQPTETSSHDETPKFLLERPARRREIEPIAEFRKSDALLAELLTEMVELRSEITEIKTQVDGLNKKPSPRAAAEGRSRKRQQISPA
jgi:hypothetical protein